MKTLITALLVIFILKPSLLFSQTCNIIAYNSSPKTYSSLNNLTISNLRIENNASGNCILLSYCNNVIIQNCILGPSVEEAIKILNCNNVTITNCSFENNLAGIYALNSSGIKVIQNKFSNVDKFKNVNITSRGQYVQFDKVTGPGNEIIDNVGECILGNSNPEDLINIGLSSGTFDSPILISGNKFRGGGPSLTGGGINSADFFANYINVYDNILVNPGQYGITVPSGTNINVVGNKIYGIQQSFTNVGLSVWHSSLYSSFACSDISIRDNNVRYYNNLGILHSLMDDGNCTNTVWTNNIENDFSINDSILPKRLLCPDLIANYTFNNDVNDYSGSGLNGVFFNGGPVNFTCGNYRSAEFNGYSNEMYIPISDWLKPSSQKISIMGWIMPYDFSRVMAIIHSQDANGWNDGWRFVIDKGNLDARIITDQGAQDASAAGGLSQYQWNHVAMVYDGSAIKIFINGNLAGSAPISGNILYNVAPHNNNMRIGNSDGDGYYFGGRMDDLKLYRGDLTDDEVLNDFNNSQSLYTNQGYPCPYIIVKPPLIQLQSDSVDKISILSEGKSNSYLINKLFPNPAHNLVNIQTNQIGKKELKLVSSDGKVVFSSNFSPQNYSLNLSKYSKGLYIILVTYDGKQIINSKIVIN